MNIPTTPDGLPSLAPGAHKPSDGQACVMEYVSMMNGESWTDHPKCTNPYLASMARYVNDMLPGDLRNKLLVPLIVRLFGTEDNSRAVQKALVNAAGVEYGLYEEPPSQVVQRAYFQYMHLWATGKTHELVHWYMYKRLVDMVDAYEKATGRVKAPAVKVPVSV